MTARIHRMPFGAELQPDGTVRFNLWAPSARHVELALHEESESKQSPQLLPMRRQEDGWYTLVTHAASAGSLYRFRIDGDMPVPDPAARYAPQDVHGPSQVIDPAEYSWNATSWAGRPWHQAVVYELHVGTFSPEGTFAGAERRLDHLVSLGITAVQLMPCADFSGKHNWGYDGVLQFAPDSAYGTPHDFKRLIDAAHRRGLMVMLDVVYNHFGPDGNYLHVYAKPFFTDRHRTPWGAGINFDDAHSHTVREFFIHNALYWLQEYHLDGLRFDAVHAVQDDSALDIFAEISRRVRETVGRERQVHLVVENVRNEAHRLSTAPAVGGRFEAQWNDDFHHCLHTILTGERDGYYQDFADDPYRLLGRCLAEGFAYQGELSRYRGGRTRGEPSGGLPPSCFLSFLQNHDQIGNRACGERLVALAEPSALRAAVAVMLLAPSPPMLFMGEEWGAREPFPFFCDFNSELNKAVRSGRLKEFARFERFRDPAVQALIPDPCSEQTMRSAKLDWNRIGETEHAGWLQLYRQLLDIRHREIVPRLPGAHAGRFELGDDNLLTVTWPLHGSAKLTLIANLTAKACLLRTVPGGQVLYATDPQHGDALPAWNVIWTLS